MNKMKQGDVVMPPIDANLKILVDHYVTYKSGQYVINDYEMFLKQVNSLIPSMEEHQSMLDDITKLVDTIHRPPNFQG